MFSLIIPYRNRQDFLPRTLRSLQSSSMLPRRIYLVNNNSTDGSEQLCQRFASDHPNWPIVLLSEPTPGAAAARNAALRLVETEWVYFFDSDDELSSCFFEEALRKLRQKPATDVVACATRMHFPDGSEKVRNVMYNASAADQILASQLSHVLPHRISAPDWRLERAGVGVGRLGTGTSRPAEPAPHYVAHEPGLPPPSPTPRQPHI